MSLMRRAVVVQLGLFMLVTFGAVPAVGLPKTRWGMNLQQVQAAYPGGVTAQRQGDSVHYRAVAAAYGQSRTLITFCFRDGWGLAKIMVEFPEAKTPIDLQVGAYARRKSNEVTKDLYPALVRAMSATYKAPTYVEEKAGSDGSTVWGKGNGTADWVRIDAAAIADDRTHLVLSFSNTKADTDDDHADKNLFAGMWGTPEDTWSLEAAFDVRWGMGPKDVLARYPALEAHWRSPDEATCTYSTAANVEGEVGIWFDFYKGRLVSMLISPYLRPNKPYHLTDEQVVEEGNQNAAWQWSVLRILKNKYADPVVDGDEDAGSTVIVGEDGISRRQWIQWAWRKDATGVLFQQTPSPQISKLTYFEIATAHEVDAATKARAQASEHKREERF